MASLCRLRMPTLQLRSCRDKQSPDDNSTVVSDEREKGVDEADFSQQPAFSEEDVQPDQGLCNQERNSTPDHEKTDPQIKVEEEEPDPQQITQEEEELEPTQIKEEEEDVCASHEGELLVMKLEADTFAVTPKSEEIDHNEVKANGEQLLSDYSADTENKDEEGSQHVDSGSSDDKSLMSKTLGENETGAPQLHNFKEEQVVLTVQQLCNQEKISSLDQEEHDISLVKEEDKDLCSRSGDCQFMMPRIIQSAQNQFKTLPALLETRAEA
ncbi:uncharacterized protein KZ484_013076 [Pholidichthys leucotaenia]